MTDWYVIMELFRLMTGQPALFADMRHYEASEDLWFFSNSGTHATYFAGASQDPAEEFLAKYPCNHIHGIYGDCTQEWLLAARALGISVNVLPAAELKV